MKRCPLLCALLFCFPLAAVCFAGFQAPAAKAGANCSAPAEQLKLAEADDLESSWKLDEARKAYEQLTQSCDPGVQKLAAKNLAAVSDRTNSWWWRSRWSAPATHLPAMKSCWWLLHVIYRFLVAWWFLMVLAVAAWIVLGLVYQRIEFDGKTRITLMTPSRLSDNTQVDLFANALQNAAAQVRKILSREGKFLQTGAAPFLNAPSSLAETLSKTVPESIHGVDVAAIVRFFFFLQRYFLGWRLESQAGFCPAIEGIEIDTLPGHLRASASLILGWKLRGGPWFQERTVRDAYDVDLVALAVVARVLGYSFRGTSAFANEDSFGWFIEGLRCLQLYEDEAAQPHPRHELLETWINSGLKCLRSCSEGYPNDQIPRFYLAITLGVKNQEIYVERLAQLSTELRAWGRALELGEWAADITKSPSERAEARSLQVEELRRALPVRELAKEPWPVLQEALHLFEEVHSNCTEPWLKEAAAYNSAMVFARLGTPEDMVRALAIVKDLPSASDAAAATASTPQGTAPSFKSYRPFANLVMKRRMKQAESKDASKQSSEQNQSVGFKWQVNILRTFLEARLAFIGSSPDATQKLDAFEKVRDDITQSKDMPYAFRTDLATDCLTKLGYMYYERATSVCDRPNLTAIDCLEISEKCFLQALTLKSNWNTAQIYLALVSQVYSGALAARATMLHRRLRLPGIDEQAVWEEISRAQNQSRLKLACAEQLLRMLRGLKSTAALQPQKDEKKP